MSTLRNRAVQFELRKLSPGDVVLDMWPGQLQTERWGTMNNIFCFPLSLNIEFEGHFVCRPELAECTLEIIGLGNPCSRPGGSIVSLLRFLISLPASKEQADMLNAQQQNALSTSSCAMPPSSIRSCKQPEYSGRRLIVLSFS